MTGDLDWLAVRHLLGELDDAEMCRFAELLGEDDAAVAALQRAARLLAALEGAAGEWAGPAATNTARPLAGGSRGWVDGGRVPGRRGRWWLAIGAAGVAAAVAVAVVSSGSASRSPGRPAELLALWRSNAERSDDGSDERMWDSDERGDADAADVAGADAPPDWLLAAVTLAEVRRQPLDSPDDQRDPRGRN